MLEQEIFEIKMPSLNLEQKIECFKTGVKNWAIDTTANIMFYYPIMISIEALNGLTTKQIAENRGTSALIDIGLARIAGKTLDYTRRKFNPEREKVKGYFVDTLTMMSIYLPVRAGIMAIYGVEPKQILKTSLSLSLTALVISKPFTYCLDKWRKKWNYQTKK